MDQDRRAALTAWADQFEAALQEAVTALDALAPLLAQSIAAMQHTVALLQQAYWDVGAPYGDTDAGFTQWLEDLGQIVRLHQQIQAIETRQNTARAVQAFVRAYHHRPPIDKP